MKNLTLLSAVALSCCGLNSSFAQIQILGSGSPTLAPQLVSDENSLTEVDPLPLEAVENPFDFFADDLPTVPDEVSYDQDSQALSNEYAEPNDLVELRDRSPSDNDPNSLPVAAHPNRSMVDTIADQAVLAGIAHASETQIFWGPAPRTPNPVAQWLLRENCVDGLWDGYQAERAAECAHMWERLSGQICGSGSGPCGACAGHQPRNRYTEHLPRPACRLGGACQANAACQAGQPDFGCDASGSCGSPVAGCDHLPAQPISLPTPAPAETSDQDASLPQSNVAGLQSGLLR